MEIERLNKIKQICFSKGNKNASKQPNQRSRSPFNELKSSPSHKVTEKENLFTQIRDNSEHSLRKRKNTSKVDHLKRYEEDVKKELELKQKKLEDNARVYNTAQIKKKMMREERNREELVRRNSQSPIIEARTTSPFKTNSSCQKIKYKIEQSHSPIRKAWFIAPIVPQKDLIYSERHSGFEDSWQSPPDVLKLQAVLMEFLEFVSLPKERPLLAVEQINELKLRLTGTFERLQINDQVDSKQQIIDIVANCFTDIYYKLESRILTSKNQLDFNSFYVYIHKLTEQICKISLEDSLPEIIQNIRSLKQKLSLKILCQSIDKTYKSNITWSLNNLKEHSFNRSKLNQSLKTIVNKGYKRTKNGILQHAFKQWSRIVKTEDLSSEKAFNKHYEHYIQKVLTNSIQLNNFFVQTKDFIMQVCQIKYDYLDIIIIKGDTGYTYTTDSDEDQIQIDLSHHSLLKNMQKSQNCYEENIVAKKDFNSHIDIPFGNSMNKILKENSSLSQATYYLYKHHQQLLSNKELKIVIRFTFSSNKCNKLMSNQLKRSIDQISSSILLAWKSFKKLHNEIVSLQKRLEDLNNNTMISDKTYNMLQYIQQKALELNYLTNVTYIFKFLTILSIDLFNYERCSIYSYSQGQVLKLYDASKANGRYQSLGQTEEKNEKVRDMILQLIEGDHSQSYRQEVLESHDSLSINGKALKDTVLLLLEPINGTQSLENMLIKQDSICVSSFSHTFQLSSSKLFIKLENKIHKASEQIPFESKLTNLNSLKSASQIFLISIHKMMMLVQNQLSKGQNLDSNNVSSDHLGDTKLLNQENEELKRILQFSREVDKFIGELKGQNIMNSFEDFENTLQQFVQKFITSAQLLKIFISKDEFGSSLYTYVKGLSNGQNSLLCTSKFQSTIPFHHQNQSSHELNQLKCSQKSRTRSKKKLFRPHSQVTGHRNVNRLIPSPLEDLSSISADEDNCEHNYHADHYHNERNSLMMNTFSQDTAKQIIIAQISRLPSAQLLPKSCRNQNSMIKNKLVEQLKRQNSNFSDIRSQNQYQNRVHLNDFIKEEVGEDQTIPKVIALSSYDEILNELKHDEFEITSNNGNYGRMNFKALEHRSILAQALQERKEINKRNAKNEKCYNSMIDGVILQGQDMVVCIENLVYSPIINAKHQIVGVVQIVNSDKTQPFTNANLDFLSLLSSKLATFLSESKEIFSDKVLFRKQYEISLISTTLENQSITKILKLANKLFQSKLQPLKALGVFVRKTEKYLKQFFTCQMSQILIVDGQTDQLLSYDFQNQSQLSLRGNINEQSIAGYLIQSGLSEPFRYPNCSEQYILIGDESNLGQAMIHNYQEYFNAAIDLPLGVQSVNNHIPPSYLATAIKNEKDHSLAIIELMLKHNGQQFSDQDIRHIQLVASHLQQVFCYVLQTGYLQQYSEKDKSKLSRLASILQKHYRSNIKSFFREILQYRYGKVNLLKNKIIRKNIDKYQKLDEKFEEQIEKLQSIAQRFQQKSKSRALHQLKKKLKYITEQRQINATKCIKIINKYSHLLSLRVKDGVFRQWAQKGFINHSSMFQNIESHSNFGNTFNGKGDISVMSSGFRNSSQNSIMGESSITSVLFLQAKALYELRKIFNAKRLRVAFDTFMLKAFKGTKNVNKVISNQRCLFLLKTENIFRNRMKRQSQNSFQVLKQQTMRQSTIQSFIKRQGQRKHKSMLSFGISRWHQQSENSLIKELKSEKIYASQLSEQYKNFELLTQLMQRVNLTQQETLNIRSPQDLLYSTEAKALFQYISEYFINNFDCCDQVVLTLKLAHDYYSKQDLYLMYSSSTSQGTKQVKQTNTIQDSSSFISANHHSSFQEALQTYSIRNSLQIQSDKKWQYQEKQDINTLRVIEGNDIILESLIQSQQSFIVTNIQEDKLVGKALKVRNAKEAQESMFVPLHDQGTKTLIGSIEIYNKCLLSKISIGDQQNRINNLANIISLAVLPLSVHLKTIEKVCICLINVTQMQQQFQLLEASQPLNTTLQYSTPKSKENFSTVIQQTVQVLIKSLKANHCNLIFIPPQYKQCRLGLFYNFKDNQLYSLDFKQTFLEEIVFSDSPRQLTFPSSLVCKAQYSSLQSSSYKIQNVSFDKEEFETITGQKFEAIKYLPVSKNEPDGGEIIAVVEIGWSHLSEATILHENDVYLIKKEEMVKTSISNSIKEFTNSIRLFLLILSKIVEKQSTKSQVNYAFDEWKRQTYFSNEFKQSFMYQKCNELGEAFTNTSIIKELSPISNIYFPTKKTVASYYSNSKNPYQTTHSNTHESEIERLPKKKLVATSLIAIALISNKQKQFKLHHAFREWQSYMQQTQVAESAFNKILEINHKHSEVRYVTASSILDRLDKKYAQRNMLSTLKSKNYGFANAQSAQINKMKSLYQCQPTPSQMNGTDELKKEWNDYKRDKRVPKLELNFGQMSNNLEEQLFQIKQDDQESEFSLGNGTKDLIQFKAESILEDARKQFRKNSYRQ